MKAINEHSSDEQSEHAGCNRRSALKAALGVTVAGIVGGVGLGIPSISYAAALTKEQRDKLTPDQIVAGLKKGNVRFTTGKMQKHNYLAQKKASAAGQFPSVVILSLSLIHI